MKQRVHAVTQKCLREACLSILFASTLSLGGCAGNVGVGVSVGVPIGNHGYMSVGSGRWF
jgi:hypothetical protein